MNSLFCLFAVLFAVALSAQEPKGIFRCRNPYTVEEVNVPQYLGLWYNIATDNITLATFQTEYCVTAEYGDNGDGTVSVLNKQRDGSVQGPEENITGYAYQPHPEDYPGKLLVHLEGGGPDQAPYWILQLGPVSNDQYSWAIVSDPVCAFMWVLAREPYLDEATTEYIQAYLTDVGFDIKTDWIPIQQDGCVY